MYIYDVRCTFVQNYIFSNIIVVCVVYNVVHYKGQKVEESENFMKFLPFFFFSFLLFYKYPYSVVLSTLFYPQFQNFRQGFYYFPNG